MPTLFRAVLLVALLAFAGCATAPSIVNDRLYFGRSIPGGGEVTDAQWAAFESEFIIPRFPDGFTVSRAVGHWRGDDGAIVSEQTSILEVAHASNPATDQKLEEIAEAYRQRFHQEAVLRLRTPGELTLWRGPSH